MPDAINLYDAALSEAERMRPHLVEPLKRLGRDRAEGLLAEAIREVQAGKTKAPRCLVDLIARELENGAE